MSEQTGFQIGFGRVEITPRESVPLRGYGSTSKRMSANILDPLYATCLAMTDETGETLLLYALDLCAFGPVSTPRLRPELSRASGIPMDHIMLSCSHTHSAPDLENTEMPSAARYLNMLEGWLLEAAKQALADRKPARMAVASVDTASLNFVRRYVLEDGTYAGDNYGHFSLSPIAAHESEADGQMQLVKFERKGGEDILLANFQGHPTRTGGVLKYDVSSDVVGAMRDAVEYKLDCRFAWFTGGSGNVNLYSRVEAENIYCDHKSHGRALAACAIKARNTFVPAAAGRIRVKQRKLTYECDHTLDHMVKDAKKVSARFRETYDRPACTKMAKELGFNSIYHAAFAIEKSGLPKTIDIELHAVSIGDVAFVLAPYEMFDTNGREIKEASPFRMTMVLTCSNADFDYIPSALGFAHGGYSVDSCRFLPGTGEKLAQAFGSMLAELHQDS